MNLHNMKKWIFAACWGLCLSSATAQSATYTHPILFNPEQYICYRAESDLRIDGRLDDPAWQQAPWTADFRDIEGEKKPLPALRTRVKMLWDDRFFYIGAELEEPHLWATLTQRDAVMFHDNDFEVFIDPDGDGHLYAEFEINALNAVWDLLLYQPYHLKKQPAYSNRWDVWDLQTAVHLQGTLNQPADRDTAWTLEIAIPIAAMMELAPPRKPLQPGDMWRVNFSRVQWRLEEKAGVYQKLINPETGKPYPEYNWVWSPTGRIDMHRPETWGWVQFAGARADGVPEAAKSHAAAVQWGLWQLFYAQQEYLRQQGKYAGKLKDLKIQEPRIPGLDFRPRLQTWNDRFIITATDAAGQVWEISEQGRIWKH